MGMYDEYAGVQLKIGPCTLYRFDIGEQACIPDGLYVGYEGIVVIQGGLLVAVHKNIFDKWGGVISTGNILNASIPVVQKLREMEPDA